MRKILILLALVAAPTWASTLVEFGNMQHDDSSLKVVKLSYEFDSNVTIGAYGGAGETTQIPAYIPSNIGDVASQKTSIRILALTAGYNIELLDSDTWTVSLKPEAVYEWTRWTQKTAVFDGYDAGKPAYTKTKNSSSDGKAVGALTLSSSVKALTVSLTYDSEQRTTISIGLKL